MVHFLPRIRDIRRIGSSALDLCHVGEGAVDAYVEEGVNYWDHAAGGLWPGSQGPAPSGPGGRRPRSDDLRAGPWLRRAARGRPRCGFLMDTGRCPGIASRYQMFTGHIAEPVCAGAPPWCTIWRAGPRSGKGFGPHGE